MFAVLFKYLIKSMIFEAQAVGVISSVINIIHFVNAY